MNNYIENKIIELGTSELLSKLENLNHSVVNMTSKYDFKEGDKIIISEVTTLLSEICESLR